MQIKRIVVAITILPSNPEFDAQGLGDYILDNYDNAAWEYSAFESSDDSHVFYAPAAEVPNVHEFFTDNAKGPFAATYRFSSTDVSAAQWPQLAKRFELHAPWLDKA